MDRTYTAWFPRMDMAIEFEARLNEGRDWVKNVSRRGRTVTFEDDIPEGATEESPSVLFMDRLDLVGYFGSTQNRKAKLNGIPAPIAY